LWGISGLYNSGTRVKSKNSLKEKSFLCQETSAVNIAGHILHDIFWKTMVSPAEASTKEGSALKIKDAIDEEFGSFKRFKEEFSKIALSVEGSGWAVLFRL